MDIGKSFSYMFDDEDWLKKIAIGAVLNIVPIVNFITMGYTYRQMKQVSEGQDLPLPEWDDFGGDFMKGLLSAVGILVYSLPIILISILSGIITAIAGQYSDVAGICATGTSCLSAIYGLALAVWTPAALMLFVKEGTLGAFFKFGDIWGIISRDFGSYIVACLVFLLAELAASIVGGIACGIGVLFTTMWAYLVMAKLFGDLIKSRRCSCRRCRSRTAHFGGRFLGHLSVRHTGIAGAMPVFSVHRRQRDLIRP